MPRPAVFFDRDDTLLEDPGFLRDPDGVRLLPGAAEAVARLREAGYAIIVVTNQSGIARGLFDEATLAAIHNRMRQLFAERGAIIDAIYYCPYLDGPEAVVERYRRDSDLRKPRPGMYALAAAEHDIDLAASWSVGDSDRDTEAGRAAGCRTIQVIRGGSRVPPPPTLPYQGGEQEPRAKASGRMSEPRAQATGTAPDYRCHTLIEAAECILNRERSRPAPPPAPLIKGGRKSPERK